MLQTLRSGPRVHQKTERFKRLNHLATGYIVVVEFSRPGAFKLDEMNVKPSCLAISTALEHVMLRRISQLLCFACLIAATSRAADEPFIGKWKLNVSKSKLADQMTIAPVGANRYTLTFAGVGETETLVADGTDQPGVLGTTISITVEAPGNWKIVRKRGSRTLLTANWKLSDDGKALTDTFISNQPDGSTSRIDLVYKRAEGSASNSGIPSTW
jgi:hypothetical protein